MDIWMWGVLYVIYAFGQAVLTMRSANDDDVQALLITVIVAPVLSVVLLAFAAHSVLVWMLTVGKPK